MRSIRMPAGRMMLVPLALAGVLVLGACSDDGDDGGDATETATTTATATVEATSTATEAATGTATATPTEAAAEGETVEVTAVDYGFEGLPESMSVGDTLALTNASDVEFHEMVVFRLPDDETRSVEELLALPEAEQEALFADGPATVLVAAPGEAGMAVLGDGTLAEAGNYVALCFIPIGADPQMVADAMASAGGEAPDLGDGPPHVTEGMYATFVVEAAE